MVDRHEQAAIQATGLCCAAGFQSRQEVCLVLVAGHLLHKLRSILQERWPSVVHQQVQVHSIVDSKLPGPVILLALQRCT